MAEVRALRDAERAQPELGAAVARIKGLQARRFAGTYADLLGAGPYAAASRFFLEELYSDRDYSDRDEQFSRIAGAIERLFPADVAETAVALARLHALTEQLDSEMAAAWLHHSHFIADEDRYLHAWRSVGRRADRRQQLDIVISLGHEMVRLTRLRGLRTMLKMMRGPAAAAGLASLQRFLEIGFDTFAVLAKSGAATQFLAMVQARESDLLALMFDAPPEICATELARALARST